MLLLAALAGGCSDGDECGPGGAADDGITLTVNGATARYGGFTAGDNQDCGLDSITIDGVQVEPAADFHLVFCVPDPAGAGTAPIPWTDDRVDVVTVTASLGGCSYTIDRATPPAATTTFRGLCEGGADPAGFALALDGTAPGLETCGADEQSVTFELAGEASVDPT